MNNLIKSISDTRTMASRSFKHMIRHIEILIMTIVMPLMQLLLLIFVFSGSMHIDGFSFSYLEYVLPGILLMTIASSASMSASSIKEDLIKGIVDRFRAMDIGRSAFLNGHMIATLLRCAITACLIFGVALLLGFRTHIPWSSYLLLFLLITFFAWMYTWLSIAWGLFCPSLEAVGALTYIGMFLPYVASCFVPIENLPSFVHLFAKYQPFTPLANSIRGLLLNTNVESTLYVAFAWCIGLGILFYVVSLHLYHKQAK